MSKENVAEEIKRFLNDRVWMTKKTRIEAEARLKLNNIISDILINYYTFFILAVSILSLVFDTDKADELTIMTIILSIGLFGLTLFLSSIGFKQKALQFKESYLKLDDLEIDIKNLLRQIYFKEETQIIDEFHKLEKKYLNILSLTDNHSNIDYQKVIISRELHGLNELFRAKYTLKKFLKWFYIGCMFIVPILLLFLFLKK